MLVTVSGAQGCGKSTVLTQLEGMGYPVIQRKTSRSILSDWGKTLDEINDDPELSKLFQDEILERKIQDEMEAVASDQVYFTERTYMDLFVYALINLGKFNEHSDWLDSYYQKCFAAQSTYSKVFYIKSGLFTVVNDGVRGSNRHYSRLIDLVMEDYTIQSTTRDQIHVIDVSGLPDRICFIEEKLKELR